MKAFAQRCDLFYNSSLGRGKREAQKARLGWRFFFRATRGPLVLRCSGASGAESLDGPEIPRQVIRKTPPSFKNHETRRELRCDTHTHTRPHSLAAWVRRSRQRQGGGRDFARDEASGAKKRTKTQGKRHEREFASAGHPAPGDPELRLRPDVPHISEVSSEIAGGGLRGLGRRHLVQR